MTILVLICIIISLYITYCYYEYSTEGFTSEYTEKESINPVAYDPPSADLSSIINNEKLLTLPLITNNLPDNLITSQKCYELNAGEVLKNTRNYLQRTNNYIHTHPDSCSAPNQELIGSFYSPYNGIGSKPNPGTNMPLCRTEEALSLGS